MSQEKVDLEPKWYVIHTYSGYACPTDQWGIGKEIKDGKRKTNLKKVFPGYVLIKMIVTEQTWYIVRNTRGVTGFVGSGTDPIPLTEDEIRKMGFEISEINVDYDVNDSIEIIDGPFKDYVGVVQEINKEKHKVKVLISMFGRETPVDLELSQVQKVK